MPRFHLKFRFTKPTYPTALLLHHIQSRNLHILRSSQRTTLFFGVLDIIDNIRRNAFAGARIGIPGSACSFVMLILLYKLEFNITRHDEIFLIFVPHLLQIQIFHKKASYPEPHIAPQKYLFLLLHCYL